MHRPVQQKDPLLPFTIVELSIVIAAVGVAIGWLLPRSHLGNWQAVGVAILIPVVLIATVAVVYRLCNLRARRIIFWAVIVPAGVLFWIGLIAAIIYRTAVS